MTTDGPHFSKRGPWGRNALWYGGFWLLVTLWLRICLPESMLAWERHQLFRFSVEYLTFFCTQPYPVLLYLQAFFTQFYVDPLLGAAVISGLLTLGVAAWYRLIGRWWPAFVWAALMLPLLPYFNLLWVLVWLVLLGGALLIARPCLPATGRRGLTAGLAFTATLLLLQENVVVAVLFWAVIDGYGSYSWRNGLYNLLAGIAGAAIGIGLLLWQGYPFYDTFFLTCWPLLSARLNFIDLFPSFVFSCPPLILILLYGGLGICLGLPFIAQQLKWTARWAIPASLLLGLCTAWVNLRYHMEDLLTSERLLLENRPLEALDIAELTFFQRARSKATGPHPSYFLHNKRQRARNLGGKLNIPPAPFHNGFEEEYTVDLLKISLVASKQGSDRLFLYTSSPLFPFLFPESVNHSVAPFLLGPFYTQNGFYAEALNLLHDRLTGRRVSRAVLELLLWNGVVTEAYAPCRKFIRFFEQSLFHRDIAHHYTIYLADTAQTALQPEIQAARRLLPDRNHAVMPYQPDANCVARLNAGFRTDVIFEYGMLNFLTYKDHEKILGLLPIVREYYPTLPTHIQEAILACFPPERLQEVPDGIAPYLKTRYVQFLQAYQLYENHQISFKKLQKEFEGTYWYHLIFNEIHKI